MAFGVKIPDEISNSLEFYLPWWVHDRELEVDDVGLEPPPPNYPDVMDIDSEVGGSP